MKFTLLALSTLMFAFSAIASNDSVAFFYSPEKVVVLINERNQSGRLDAFMKHFGNGESLQVSSHDNKMMISCVRAQLGIGCNFKFFPAQDVQIQNRTLNVVSHVENLGLPNAGAFEMSFASSMKDKFNFSVNHNGEIRMTGSKILGQ